MTYPISFRRKVLSIREKENLSIAQVAKRFCVGIASVTRWIKTPARRPPATSLPPGSTWRSWRTTSRIIRTRISTSAPNGWESASKALIAL
ncbi:hypothetical protein [Nitrosomonas sp. Nm34]|uniref:hypothetical protein n=1 Tax=Nitrosomonas sp. Nm34 TaxID=1881055 RepID=UPI0020C899BA|nr:hypothetical protein [Nitrosomonas sp. Nm34]